MQLITVSSGHTSPRYTDEWGMLMSSPRARRDSKEKKNGRHGSRSKSKPTSRGMLSEIRSVGKKGERKNQSSGVPKPLQIFMKNLKVCAQDEIRVTGKGSPEHGSSDLIKKIICNKGTTKQVKQNVSSSLQTSKRRSKEKLKKTQEESEKTQTSSLASPLFLNTVRTPLLKQKTHDSLVLGKVKKPLKMLEGRTFTNELKITDFSPLESKRKKTMSKSPQPGSRYNEPLMPKLSSIRAKKSRKQIDKKGQSKLKSSKKTKNSLKNRLLKKGFGNYGLPSQEECRSGGLQRHYLLNQPGPMNMKFLGQEDDSQTARDTIKVDFASKYECLGEQSLGDKTCKMFNMEVPTVENYFQKKTAPEEARAAERIQKFYLEWNEKEDVNSNNKPLTKSGLIKSVVENSKEDVKPPTDGGSSARANLIHSTSSNMDKNVSLCLSYTKYGMKKEERGQLTEDNTSSNAKKKLKAVTSFEGLGQRPDIFRSISKIVKSAKKSKLASKSKDSSTSSKNSNEKIILPTDLNFNKKITERKTSPGVGELILNIDDGRKLKPPSVPRINLDGIDTFAKAEYCKWTKVTNILQTIEKKMGGKAADEIQLLFKQLEAFAEVSKKNVKDAFFPQDSIPSGLVSELGTFRQDSSQRGNSFFERKMAIKRPVAAEGLPCGTTGEPAPEFEAKSSLEYGDSPQMSKSGAEFTRRSKGVALERWVDHSVLIRSSSSSRLIESKTIAIKQNLAAQNLTQSSEFCAHDARLIHQTEEPSHRLSPAMQCLETGSSGSCQRPAPPENTANLVVHAHSVPFNRAAINSNTQRESEPVVRSKPDQLDRLQIDQESNINSNLVESCDRKEIIEEHKSQTSELFNQFVEDRLHKMSFNSRLDDDQPILASNLSENEGSEFNQMKLVNELKASRIADEICEHLLEEALYENQEIQFRNTICPEDLHVLSENTELAQIQYNEPAYAIRTSHHSIADFLSILIDFIMEHFSENVLERFNKGYTLDPAQIIRFLREKELWLYSPEEEAANFSTDFEGPARASMLKESWEIEELLEETIFYTLQAEANITGSAGIEEAVKTQMVYQRAIFDAFNEALTDIWSGGSAPDYVRLISLGKKPPRHTLANKEELEIVLCLAREQVLEVATSLCGMIRDKEDSVLGCIQEIDQAVLNQVREQRLVKMLARHVSEQERSWVHYSKEELVTLIDCSDRICEDLIAEVAIDLSLLHQRNKS